MTNCDELSNVFKIINQYRRSDIAKWNPHKAKEFEVASYVNWACDELCNRVLMETEHSPFGERPPHSFSEIVDIFMDDMSRYMELSKYKDSRFMIANSVGAQVLRELLTQNLCA